MYEKVEEMIEKKKVELIEEVEENMKKSVEAYKKDAVRRLETRASEIKEAFKGEIKYSDGKLLEIVEKGGFIYQKILDLSENYSWEEKSIDQLLNDLNSKIRESRGHTDLEFKTNMNYRVTLLIEPIEKEKDKKKLFGGK